MPTKTKTGDSQPRQIQGHQQVTWPGGLLLSIGLNLIYPNLTYFKIFLLVSAHVHR